MPVEQTRGRQVQPGRVVRVDHHQHVEAVDKEVDFLLQHLAHDVAIAPPRLGMLGVTRRQHADLARPARGAAVNWMAICEPATGNACRVP